MRLIIDRYLMREMALSFFAVSLLLVVIFFSGTFIRLLGETLEGDYPAHILFSLFALKGVGTVVFILPFAFFIAVLLTFTRLYKDNEIVVLAACGAGPRRLFSSVATLALVVSVLVGYLTLFFTPWAEEQSSQLLDEAGARQEIEGIVPGRFNSFGSDSPTIYVERYDAGKKQLFGLFVQGAGEEEDSQYILRAESAYERIERGSGERYLVLQNGYRYEGQRGERDYRITRFVEHGIRIRKREVVASSRPRYAIDSMTLWRSDDNGDSAELQRRLSVPISALLLALLAVPLSKSAPRRSRYTGLFAGILIYVIYNNLLTWGLSALGKGEVPQLLGVWWVHLMMLGLLGWLLWRQQSMKGPRSSVRTVA